MVIPMAAWKELIIPQKSSSETAMDIKTSREFRARILLRHQYKGMGLHINNNVPINLLPPQHLTENHLSLQQLFP